MTKWAPRISAILKSLKSVSVVIQDCVLHTSKTTRSTMKDLQLKAEPKQIHSLY